jgi:hypothetical protein
VLLYCHTTCAPYILLFIESQKTYILCHHNQRSKSRPLAKFTVRSLNIYAKDRDVDSLLEREGIDPSIDAKRLKSTFLGGSRLNVSASTIVFQHLFVVFIDCGGVYREVTVYSTVLSVPL